MVAANGMGSGLKRAIIGGWTAKLGEQPKSKCKRGD